MKCYICGKVGPDKYCIQAQEWDWFHGYLNETVHFCPTHKNTPQHGKLLLLSRIKPEENSNEMPTLR